VKRSEVRRVGGIHTLRHCFATFLMEQGVDIYTIQRWMGHTSVVTTGRYMHVRSEHLRKVKSPLDTLYEKRVRAPPRKCGSVTGLKMRGA